ncbi:Cysteine peptidase, cysteine active site,Peptidase C1A, papain C-terminal,Peptidase C1A [Cinara cedri]|uniref:Cysteine peptidase, cysteine active site,Peptidase C1A, papain C-terminal,Peptidase C1A n=1 Tax=Cinara cedri TaxID=506608 RepID=A0A5E4NP74_9HEMI|nr:Cysteine peptidase, cysteine active site,Peptidase C1A, papain C-terminal,Peptidase C1A [Cinara cedri]
MITQILVFSPLIMLCVYQTEQTYFLQTDFINKINEEATTWKAGVNFNPKTTKEYILHLLGSKGVQLPNLSNSKLYKTNDVTYEKLIIPKKFDSRKQWSRCTTIGRIRDQGHCGSCWAFATSSAFADRLCIATNGNFNELLSADELTFCCHLCGFGCRGGYPIRAWNYFHRHGLVTGGNYNTTEGCEPYTVSPCPYDKYGNNTCYGKPIEKNHNCKKMCYGDKTIDYKTDHKYTRDYYYLTYTSIQKDVLVYGPIEASFNVYDDFLNYKSGIYVKTENATYLGGHAVKLIGWGEDKGIPYWLMVNSWNEDWGEKGLFKIRRGTNECGIDNSTTGGVPVVF